MHLSTTGGQDVRRVEHRIEVSAPPEAVYEAVVDVGSWPRIFAPTIHVERLEHDGGQERIQLWATANGEVKTWISRREFDPAKLAVAFRQEVSQSPVAAMGGEWVIEPLPGVGASVLLTHDYVAAADVPGAEKWIAEAVDRNSTVELAALKAAVEAADTGMELTFEDSVLIDGPLPAVHEFLDQPEKWPDRLPHVSRVDFRRDDRDVQHLEMDTQAADGSTHTTTSVRIGLPDGRIVYKQLALPPLLTLHLGCWTLTPEPAGQVRAVSWHTVRIDPVAVAPILGPDKNLEDAKAYVRSVLGANSSATLSHAKAYAEGVRRD